MNLKKKIREFCSLTRTGNGGFTLVELIVVIAILAILAGIAVPAYSGYIQKAEKAGDLQLLGAVNEAFAAACLSENTTIAAVNSAFLTWDGAKVVGISKVDGAANTAIDAAFKTFYAGNEGTEFKVLANNLVFDAGKHVFIDPTTASSITVNDKGSNVTVSGSALQALNNSTFGTIGSEALLDKINNVTNAATLMAGSLNAVFTDSSFTTSAMTALGATTPEEYATKQEELIVALQAKNPDLSRQDAIAQISANAAVLYASQNAVGYTDEQLSAVFTGGSEAIKNNLKGADAADGMAQAAIVYGMYTAYAHSAEYGSADKVDKANNNPIAALNALEDDENFIKYVNSAQGQKDLDAYMGSLGVIVDSTSNNANAVQDIIVNGYNNDDLKGIIGGLLG